MREAKFRNLQVVQNEPGRLVGGSILAILIGPQLYFAVRGFQEPASQPSYAAIGLYLIFIGSIFLVSYYVPEKSFVFRWFLWLCEHGSAPSGRWMAFFYTALGFFLGGVCLFKGVMS